MAETTRPTGVSRERLNQIAARKLQALGIPAALGADGVTLCGELTLAEGRVLHPAGGPVISTVRFSVVGHDHLQALDAPLRALGPVKFYDLERVAGLEERFAQALRTRMAMLKELAGRLQALALPAKLDPERLLAVSVVKTVECTFELSAGPHGVRVERAAPLQGTPFEVSAEAGAIRLEEYPAASDLELDLMQRLPRLRATAPAASAPAVPVIPGPPPPGAVTLARLAEKLGDAWLSPGPRLELTQDFDVGGQRYRFVVTADPDGAIRGRLLGSAGEKWSDRIDLERFPGTVRLIRSVLGLQAEEPAASSAAVVAGHMAPQVGEVWVMNVLIEDEDPNEVRYTCVNVNGRPYGAARILAKRDFEAVFARQGAGWRLLIVIEQVQGGSVTYRQLDSNRQPRGALKTLAAATLVDNFVPEAAAY